MSRRLFPLSLSATLLAGTAMAEVPRVAVDIAPVHSLVARVMEGVGTPDLIVPAGASPHEYSLRPSEAAALQEADLVFWMGADLSPWMDSAIDTLTGDAEVTALLEADETMLLEFRENALFEAHSHGDEGHDHGHDDDAEAGAHDHDHEEHAEAASHDHDHDHEEHAEEASHDHDHAHEEHAEAASHDHDHDHEEHADAHDHDHGHAHGEHDPHAWLSPDNAASWLNLIAGELSAADPDNASAYFANAAAAQDELEALVTEIDGILEPVRGGRFVGFHDAYQYFETAFDFPASGAISLSDARDPSPARIAEIQGRVADEGIDCVLAEPQFDPGIVATVMEGTEARTAVLDPLGSDLAPGPDLYPQMMRNLATSLASCL
jgi:zinc transport system substrate-binding protein